MGTYQQAIRAARERYKEAMDAAAADAVFISREHERPLQTVCKDIAGDEWQKLRGRAQRFEKTAGQSAEQAARAREKAAQGARERHAKAVLKNPEQAARVIASLTPEAQDTVYHEAKLIRSGEDRSPANHKAAKAAAHHAVAPMKRALAQTTLASCVASLQEATQDLQEAMDDDALTAAAVKRIETAHNQFVDVLTEAVLRVEGARA